MTPEARARFQKIIHAMREARMGMRPYAWANELEALLEVAVPDPAPLPQPIEEHVEAPAPVSIKAPVAPAAAGSDAEALKPSAPNGGDSGTSPLDARTPEWRETMGNLPSKRQDAIVAPLVAPLDLDATELPAGTPVWLYGAQEGKMRLRTAAVVAPSIGDTVMLTDAAPLVAPQERHEDPKLRALCLEAGMEPQCRAVDYISGVFYMLRKCIAADVKDRPSSPSQEPLSHTADLAALRAERDQAWRELGEAGQLIEAMDKDLAALRATQDPSLETMRIEGIALTYTCPFDGNQRPCPHHDPWDWRPPAPSKALPPPPPREAP